MQNKANLGGRRRPRPSQSGTQALLYKQSQFRSTAGGTLRLRTARRDLQYSGEGLGVMLVRTSCGEREL